MLRIVRNAYTFNVGVQMVPQKSHFVQDYKGVHADTVRTVTNFAPTMDFRWKRNQQSQLRFTYRANTSQPSMSDLLDITDNTDPLNIQKGNPGLKPSFTQNFRLNYNDYIQRYQRAIMTFVNFSMTSNSISNKSTYNPGWSYHPAREHQRQLERYGRIHVQHRSRFSRLLQCQHLYQS